MIRITSRHVDVAHRDLIKRFSKFVLNKIVKKKSLIGKTDIIINIITAEELIESGRHNFKGRKKVRAWVDYNGMVGGRKKFTVWLNAKRINYRAKKDYIRLKGLFQDLAHELTHVKQYMTNELFDYTSGDVRFKDEYFSTDKYDFENSNSDYYNSPWEIEAFGREWGLFKMFKLELEQERKGSPRK